jgi:hypothetical protein
MLYRRRKRPRNLETNRERTKSVRAEYPSRVSELLKKRQKLTEDVRAVRVQCSRKKLQADKENTVRKADS